MLSTDSVTCATLLQLVVIIPAARVCHLAARALGQPGAVGEIIAGLLLGPSAFAALAPHTAHALFAPEAALPLSVISQIGLILLMFQIGSEFEWRHMEAKANRRMAMSVAGASVVAPFLAGVLAGRLTAPILAPGVDALTYSLFVGVAFAITPCRFLGAF